MTRCIKISFALAVLGLAIWASFKIGYHKGQREPITKQTDTTTTIVEKVAYKPREVATITYSAIPIPRVIFRNDTIVKLVVDSVAVSLPIEHKVYRKDGEYEIGISGVTPALDYAKTFARESVITKEVAVPTKRKWSVGLQLGIGPTYGLIGKRWDVGPYLGVGIGYNF